MSAPRRLRAADVWWAVRESLVASPVARHEGNFSIQLFVGRQLGRTGYLSALKPLLDGLIAALQTLPAHVDSRDLGDASRSRWATKRCANASKRASCTRSLPW
jgi:hypothetical protein